MRKSIFILLIIFISIITSACISNRNNELTKPRTIVTTDGEIDDFDSFIRFLLYSNELDVEGLIYSSSQFHWAGDGLGTLYTSEKRLRDTIAKTDLRWCGTEWMQNFISKYSLVYDNLIKHDPAYPEPDYLKSIVKTGNIEFEGEMSKDSEGSDWIKSILLDSKPGPVYVQAWGGTNTMARALKSIEDEFKDTPKWQNIFKKVSEKTVIYIIFDQDNTYKNYIKPNWPDIKVIYNKGQFWSFAYMWAGSIAEGPIELMKGPWFKENIKFNHGPLLESYYLWGDGQKIKGDSSDIWDKTQLSKHGRMQYDFVSEGDSPSYFYLLNNAFGLGGLEDPSYGGLGGRFEKNDTVPNRWDDGKNVKDFNPITGINETSYPQTRWVETLQNDFAARAAWCVKEYNEANHAPVATLKIPSKITTKPGNVVTLKGSATDPDGDSLEYKWWQYVEAGTLNKTLTIEDSEKEIAYLNIPSDASKGDTIHIVFEVTDNGTPKLTRYQRVVITVI